MNGPSKEDDLPEPEIETILNFAGLSPELKAAMRNGALLTLSGRGIKEHAVSVGVLSEVLVHFDRLFRIMQAIKSGFDVRRTGRLVEVAHTRHLTALPALASSYVLPLRLEDPEGELVAEDHQELEAVMELLSGDDIAQLSEKLSSLPERVGDELYWLLRALVAGDVNLAVEAVREGVATAPTRVDAEIADRRATWLTEPITSEVGVETLRGKLFRIDTKRLKIAVDVSQEEDESTVIEEASFSPDQLESLREALNGLIELQVSVIEEKRRYERTARSRTMAVTSVRRLTVEDEPASSP
jgi:hypothetical protein